MGRATCPMRLAIVAARIRPPSKTTPNAQRAGVAADARARRRRSLRFDVRPMHHVSFSSRDRERRSTPPITANTHTYTHKQRFYLLRARRVTSRYGSDSNTRRILLHLHSVWIPPNRHGTFTASIRFSVPHIIRPKTVRLLKRF